MEDLNGHKFSQKEIDYLKTVGGVIEVLADAITISDPEKAGIILQCNASFEKMFGYSRDEVIGKRWGEVGIASSFEDKRQSRQAAMDCLHQGLIHNIEMTAKRKNGTTLAVLMSFSLMKTPEGKSLIVKIVKDISGLKKIEAAIRNLKEYNENIVRNIPIAILTCNGGLKINAVNKGCCAIFNLKEDDIVGRHLSEILGAEVIKNGNLDKKILETLQTRKSLEVEIKGIFPRMGEREVNLKIVPIMGEEEVMLLIKDITEQRELEEDLREADKLAAVGQIAGGVAHEINNPLAIIKGNVQYLQKTAADLLTQDKIKKDDIKKCAGILERISEEAERCSKITSGLLEFIRKDKEIVSPLDINKELVATLLIMEQNLSRAKIKIIKKLQPVLPKILGNANQLRQVFMNIILNAQQAMPKGGNLKLETLYNKHNKSVEIRFIDRGEGISQENLRKLFIPFFTTKKIGKGIGLGLSISYGIINAHRGTIKVKSKPGKGSLFTIKFPAIRNK